MKSSRRNIKLTAEQRIEVTRMLDAGEPFTHVATYLEVCVDTCKRIVVREGIRHLESVKYHPGNTTNTERWTRRCLSCRDLKTMIRWQYVCNDCKDNQAKSRRHLHSLPNDSWLLV